MRDVTGFVVEGEVVLVQGVLAACCRSRSGIQGRRGRDQRQRTCSQQGYNNKA